VPEGDARRAARAGRGARAGRDVTLVSYAKTVGACLQAADALAEPGVSAEVIDLRTLKPLDEAAVLALGAQDRPPGRRARGQRRPAASAPRSRRSSPSVRSTR
jgi:hypothetical protein